MENIKWRERFAFLWGYLLSRISQRRNATIFFPDVIMFVYSCIYCKKNLLNSSQNKTEQNSLKIASSCPSAQTKWQ